MGKLDGKVAFITGAARGQGRSHALRLAQEGADIIAVDICRQIDSVPYPMATPEDLAETVAQVEALDRRIVSAQADVRDAAALRASVSEGVNQLGRLDIVLANAGISAIGLRPRADRQTVFRDVVDVNLTGVYNTVRATAAVLLEQNQGGAIVITSSTQGLTGRGGDGSGAVALRRCVVARVGRQLAASDGPAELRPLMIGRTNDEHVPIHGLEDAHRTDLRMLRACARRLDLTAAGRVNSGVDLADDALACPPQIVSPAGSRDPVV